MKYTKQELYEILACISDRWNIEINITVDEAMTIFEKEGLIK